MEMETKLGRNAWYTWKNKDTVMEHGEEWNAYT